MATQNTNGFDGANKEINSSDNSTNNPATRQMTHEEHETAKAAARFGYGPLAHINTAESGLLPAFGGEFQPGAYRAVKDRKIANPAPLGLSAFALTTFVLSLINMGTRDIGAVNVVIGAAFGYGGLIQLLAGMWEMAVGNTFGATALSSYGGFWIAFGIIEVQTPADVASTGEFRDSFGLFLMGWFIFTTVILLCTLRSTVAFFLLFFFLDLTFMLLGIAYLQPNAMGQPTASIQKAGGFFGLLAAFMAWYNALAGIADDSNSFFVIPVAHFPWSAIGMEKRGKTESQTV